MELQVSLERGHKLGVVKDWLQFQRLTKDVRGRLVLEKNNWKVLEVWDHDLIFPAHRSRIEHICMKVNWSLPQADKQDLMELWRNGFNFWGFPKRLKGCLVSEKASCPYIYQV